jgi:hypothetical protein
MGVKVSESKSFTVTTESDLYVVPDPYVAYLKRLGVTNGGTETATVTFKAYNGDAGKTILTVSVAAGGTVVLAEDELPTEGIPTRITVTSTVQPYSVDYSLELE